MAQLLATATMERVGDDLGPVSVPGFGRLSWVGVDGGLTGPTNKASSEGQRVIYICFAVHSNIYSQLKCFPKKIHRAVI